MKIIHIVGHSNSGKTTLLKALIPALAAMGRVGVVKHLGHHSYELTPGKDTTVAFSAGATIAVGIDGEKSVAAIRTVDPEAILRLLSDTGMDFALIEGFKTRPYAKVIIGTLEAENCVLRNPTVAEILASLDRFDDYPPARETRDHGGVR